MSAACPPAAAARRRPRDATEALNLPAVPADHLDRVLHAAGARVIPALAVLVAALGWHLARNVMHSARPAVLAGLPGAIRHAARLHGDAQGRG